jgi:hypothetical protein
MTHQLNNDEAHQEHQGIIIDKLLKIFHLNQSDIRNPTFDIFKCEIINQKVHEGFLDFKFSTKTKSDF